MMMRPRLGACLSALFTGEHGVVSVSARLRAVSYIRTLANFQSEGIQSLKQSFLGSPDEDDDFAELGSPVAQGVSQLKKLQTEKPEHFTFKQKKEQTRRSSSGMSLHSEVSPSLKDNSSKLGSSSVSIEKIPSSVKLSQLKEALSVFGKISKASMRSKIKKDDFCNIQFESVESFEKAISVGVITVKNHILPIRPLLVEDTVTFRISNIGSETADSTIYSMCMLYGTLEGLVRTKKGEVDALFGVKDNSDSQRILEKLNHTITDDCKWTACLHPKDSASEVMSNNNDKQCNFEVQISNHLDVLKKEIMIKKVLAEDLQLLHNALVHLEAHPATGREVPNID